MKENVVIVKFLLKEEGKSESLYTDGNKLIYNGTCLAQWKNSSILLNNTFYDTDTNSVELFIFNKVRDSLLLYRYVSKKVPRGAKNILKYE